MTKVTTKAIGLFGVKAKQYYLSLNTGHWVQNL